MTQSTPGFRILFSTLAVLAFGVRLLALEPEDVLFIQKGPLTFRPQFSLSELYNDNIFYQSQDQVQDLITDISPGLKLQLGRPEHNYISLSYTLDELLYADHSDLDAPQHAVLLSDQFQLERLKLVGSDRFQLASSPPGGVVERIIGTNGLATIVGSNVDRLSFEDSYTLSYDLGEKTGIYVRANHNSSDYQQGIGLYDIETLVGTFGFGYRAFPKTIFFGELYYGLTTTDPNIATLPPNPDLNFVGGYVGVRGNFTEKLSGMVKAGFEQREFAENAGSSGDPVVDMALTQRFSEKQSLSLTYSRQSSVSVQYSRQTYTTDSMGLQFTQLLGPSRKWQVGLGGNYSMYSYDQSGANAVQYDYVRASVSLAYRIQRWLTTSLGYDFERVIGDNRAVIDYDVNRVTLRLAIGY
jgi:hypothetical protein